MWGTARVFNIFPCNILQKSGELVSVNVKKKWHGEILVKCPNLVLERKVSKNDEIVNATSLSHCGP